MKVVLLNDDHPLWGGNSVSTLTGAFASAYRTHGHAVTVITSHRKEDEPRIIRQESIISLPISYRPSLRSYLSLRMPSVSKMLKQELEVLQPDAVHAHNIHTYLTYDALKIARTHTPHVFLTLHDSMSFSYGRVRTQRYLDSGGTDAHLTAWDHLEQAGLQYNPFRNTIIRKILTSSTEKIITVSHALEKAAIANGIPHTMTIHNGIDLSVPEPSPEDIQDFMKTYRLEGRPIILFGGRLSEDKGITELLQALTVLKTSIPSILILLACDTRKWSTYVKEHKVSGDLLSSICCTGWLPKETLHTAYRVAHVVTTPSVCLDTFNLMNAEAMAARKPVVGTIFGGTPEIVEHKVTGFVCDPRDTKTYAGYLQTLLQNPALQESMGQAGRKRVEDHFSLSLMLQKYLHLLPG
jgi:glycosyltransferase involved in cell wall biosynthesis